MPAIRDDSPETGGVNAGVTIGVIGAGMVAQIAHLPAIAQVPGLRLAAIADLDLGLARGVAARFCIPRVCASHAELLADPAIGAVVVVTHRHRSAAIVRDALRAGKHVLCEKPMAMSLDEARELVGLSASRGLVHAVGFMKRHDEGVARALALLDELRRTGRLGRLIHVRGKNFCARYVGAIPDHLKPDPASQASLPAPSSPVAPAWLDASLAEGYDWLANVALHSINLLRHLSGSTLRLTHADVRAAMSATLCFDADGVPVTLDCGRAATGRWEEGFEFFFERGRVELMLTSLMQRGRCARVVLDENGQEPPSQPLHAHEACERWCFTHQMQAFADAVGGRCEALRGDARDALRDMELLEEIFRMRQGAMHD